MVAEIHPRASIAEAMRAAGLPAVDRELLEFAEGFEVFADFVRAGDPDAGGDQLDLDQAVVDDVEGLHRPDGPLGGEGDDAEADPGKRLDREQLNQLVGHDSRFGDPMAEDGLLDQADDAVIALVHGPGAQHPLGDRLFEVVG